MLQFYKLQWSREGTEWHPLVVEVLSGAVRLLQLHGELAQLRLLLFALPLGLRTGGGHRWGGVLGLVTRSEAGKHATRWLWLSLGL